ncbi:MAG TPA: MBG domain-containing protein [Rhodocyclaceae bacterium]|nr:MBG domain-containing protein [Rhodocyclaceae bacterium]
MRKSSLNHVYRLVWSHSQGRLVAVAESTASRRKGGGAAARAAAVLMAGGLLAGAAGAADLPSGGQVVAGSGGISQSGATMTVRQDTAKMAIDWQGFSIGQGHAVNFVQPSASAVALNRVLGSDVSVIQGALNANGQVFLVNPNGVLFTPTAQVNVGGLVASTLNLSTADFLAGNYRFEGASSNAIINQGNITAAKGGAIALIAARIVNDGSLTAQGGNVLIGAGSKVTLDLGGPVKIEVEQGAIDALIQQGGAIKADGGLVYLTAKAAGDLASTVINHTGVIEAQTLATGEKGQIYLLGGMDKDRITVGGTLDASAPRGGDGGAIETSAATVDIRPDIKVTTAASQGATGHWLIDPYDVTIAASGGNITGATIATALNSTNVTIDTTNGTYGTGGSSSGTAYGSAPSTGVGDITVNDAITKTGGAGSGTTLTLKAHNDININQAITSTGGRLNVVLVADQDNSGAGSISFGPAGRVVTKDGNFYVGSVSGTYDTVAATAQDFTMASGSYIDAGTGNLVIAVKGNITLPDNSAQAVTYALKSAYNESYRYFNSGNQTYYYYLTYPNTQYLGLSSANGSITSANGSSTIADIVTSVDTRLSAPAIGGPGAPIRISGPADPYGLVSNPTYSNKTFANTARTLFLTNTAGDSYVDEIGVQIFSKVDVTVGGQASATQNIQIMGDQGGTGHILLNTDGSGVLAIGTGDVKTGGVPGQSGSYTSTPQGTDPTVFPTSVAVTAPNITFANNSVDTGSAVSYYYQGTGTYYKQNWGMASYWASFSAYGTTALSGASPDSTADIKSMQLYLTSPNIGSSSAPLDLGSGSLLNLDNSGGSTFVKVVDNSIGSVNITNRNTSGEHHVLWSTGDHIDYTTDADGIHVPTIGGGPSNGSDFTTTSGIDTSLSGRSATLNTVQGAIELDTNSVNLGAGAFNLSVSPANTVTVGGKAIFGKNPFDGQAEVTAGDVSLNVYNTSLVPAGIADLEFAKGGTSTNNTLTLSSYRGDIAIRELTANHFKSINVTLNGASAAQNVAVDLAGADDVNFSDSGSLVSIDATKVNLSANNRNWNLQAPGRTIQVDGVALGSGNYTLYGGNGLRLNADLLTNGGNINLTAGGAQNIALLRSLRIDSNADDSGNSASTGAAGQIYVYSNVSGTGPYSLTVDSSSSTNGGGGIYFYGNAGNAAGSYLSGLTLTSKGSANTNDGGLYVYGSSYLVNGDFSATGNTYVQSGALTIDTEQGNTNNGGNISFAGQAFNPYYWGSLTLNTATTAAGKNGGNVDLYGTYNHNAASLSAITVTTTGGSGGSAGSIALPAVSTAQATGTGSQTYNGGTITLYGNLATNQSAVTLNGDVRIANDLTIDTWSSASNAATGTAGAVTINGGLGATAAGKTLTIDTGTATGDGYADAPTNTLAWTHNGGAVNIAGGSGGGTALGSLVVTTAKGGTHNIGGNGAITLAGINTTGTQTYTGGALNLAGDLTASAVTINTVTSGATVGGSGVVTAADLLLNGLGTTYNLASGSGHKVGRLAATNAASLSFLNNDVDLLIGTIGGVSGIDATGTINVATNAANLTVAQNLTTADGSAGAIVLNAGKAMAAGNGAGGNILVSGTPVLSTGAGGRVTLYTGSVDDSTGLTSLVGSGSGRFRYNSDESATGFTTALGSGLYAIYRAQPTIDITAADAGKTYDGQAFSGGNGFSATGFVNGDTDAVLTGTAAYGGASQGAVNAGSHAISVSGLANGLGYAVANHDGTLTVARANLTATANAAAKTYDGQAFNGGNGMTYSGFVAGDSAASLGGTLAYGGSAQGAVNAGTYTLSASGLTSGNYDITYVNGTLAVGKAALTATANNAAKTYDGLAFNGGNGVTFSGFVAGDSAASLGGTLAYGGSAQGAVNAGTHTLSASGLTSGNYDITYVNGTLAVGKASLTATARDAAKTYDGLAFSGGNGVTYNGFVAGESESDLGGALAYGGSAQGAVNPGSYSLKVSGLASGNYDIHYVDGTLTVDQQPVALTTAISLPQTTQPPVVPPVNSNPAPSVTPPGSTGGLVLVEVGHNDAPGTTSSNPVSSGGAPSVLPAAAGGADVAGFMRVFVVDGGINLPSGVGGSGVPLSSPNTTSNF